MTRRAPLLVAVVTIVVVAAACDRSAPPPPPVAATPAPAPEPALTKNDVHSHAIPAEARVTHLALDLTADFAQRVLRGTAAMNVLQAPGAEQLVLDAKGLDVASTVDQSGAALPFTLSPELPYTGAALTVRLRKDTTRVVVQYATRPDAAALQWLTAAQTAGKQHPYLFTQGQAILTRTWIPVQDSPGLRFTYEARIRVDPGLTAVMSAQPVGAPEGKLEGSARVFTFDMPEKIPAYLIALAVGDLKFQALGPRTGVWSEPSMLAAAAAEFHDVEQMIGAVEAMYGPYRWGRYDVLVLPPSFPFGGMENPRLTFVSPTVIAGDRSLVSLIVHELAHSWSGNLVTNATWSDFWLNEGVTVYIEGRIVEHLYGRRRAEVDAALGFQELQEEIADWGAGDDRSKLSRAIPPDEDPDDSVTSVPYIKGASFLQAIEAAVGRAPLDAFLKRYFDDHAFAAMTTERFVELVRRDLPAAADKVPLDEWVNGIGVPASFPAPTSARIVELDALVSAVAAGASPTTLQPLSALERVYALKGLPRARTVAELRALDEALALGTTKNMEVAYEWLRLVIANRYAPALPQLEAHLTTIGRRKLVLPLYEELAATTWGKPIAAACFAKARASYHPLTTSGVEAILQSTASLSSSSKAP